MIRSVRALTGAAVQAVDGFLGEVEDVYFDDGKWVVRYYVVDTGSWLPGRKVLLPPEAALPTKPGEVYLRLSLTKEQVRRSPEADTERPVEKQVELSIYRHYGWTPAWFPLDATASPADSLPVPPQQENDVADAGGDAHLHSGRALLGYGVEAANGTAGRIEDVIFHVKSREVLFVAVDTGDWLPGKRVAVPPGAIARIAPDEATVFLNLTCDEVKQQREFVSLRRLKEELEGTPAPLPSE